MKNTPDATRRLFTVQGEDTGITLSLSPLLSAHRFSSDQFLGTVITVSRDVVPNMPQVDFHQMSLKLAKFDRGHFQEQTDVSFSNLSIAHEGVSLIQMREGQTISVVMGSVLTGEGDVPVSLNVRGMATQEAPIYPRVNVLTNIVKMAKSCAGSLLNDSRQIMPSGTMKLASNLRKMITKNCG